MSILYYLENFNSYYNRTIKRATEKDLGSFMDFVLKVDSDFNFNPNDHVSTKIVVNYTYYENGIEYNIDDDRNIDYILVSEDNQTVKSKWFVTDRVRNLGGQWSLTLRRDLISDYYNIIRESPIFVEKGWLPSSNNLIFNSENMTYNKIKKKEVLLKDKSATPWIVGYISNDYYETPLVSPDVNDGNGYVYAETSQERQPTYSASWLELRALGRVTTGATISNQTVKYTCAFPNGHNSWVFEHGKNGIGATAPGGTNYNTNWYCSGTVSTLQSFRDAFIAKATRDPYFIGPTLLKDYIPGYKASVATLKTYSGQALYNTDYIEGQEATYGPKYFYFDMVQLAQNVETVRPAVNSRVYTEMKYYIMDIYDTISSRFYFNEDTSMTGTFEVEFPCEVYSCSVSTVPSLLKARTDIYGSVDGTILPKQQLYDAPYTMFATPYKNCIIDLEGGGTINHNGVVARNICSQISKILGGSGETSYMYDLQLLPYCPVPQLLEDAETGHLNLQRWSRVSANHSLIKTDDDYSTTQGMIFWLSGSSFKSYVDLEEPIVMPNDPIEAKVDIETKMCRLVSPNYAGVFEFTPVKNGGVSSFEVNCTYKPYQPYIHVNPLFNTGFLYGGDYDDNRGLICGGDFSLPQVSDAWINYQTQNRSYRESFNRQIENMEVNNAVQREREIWSAVAGSVAGAAGGAVTGGYIGGGPVGAAIGGAVGGVAAIAGGNRDIQLADKLRAEALDYTKDQFGYSLQNIKALPNTMSRTSAFDINNKLFPFLEYYGCFEEEEKALKNKLKYNGMTIMVIGYIDEYIRTNDISYFKGQLIRFEGSAENHEIVEIANELNKGVFI